MKIYFNSSLPRSGSTLLQNILAQNPRFYCSPTSGVVDMLDAARKAFTESPLFKLQKDAQSPERFYAFCRGAMLYYYTKAAPTEALAVFDKSRAWIYEYELLKGIYEKPKVIVCVRDIRTILSSMEKLHRKNPHLSDPSANPGAMQFLTIDQRVASWIQNPPVGLSLKCLMDCIHRGVDADFHFVRYEDLTTHPEVVMDRLYEYLGEEGFIHNFNEVKQEVEENDAIHGIYGDHQVRPVVQPVKKDYNDTLGKEISAAIVQNNAWFYDKFYPKD